MIPSERQKKTHLTGSHREYHYINALIFLFTLGLLLTVKLKWFSARCVYAEKGLACKSCGLTRAFEGMLNGNFLVINPAFLTLFLLIGGQLLARPLVSLLLLRNSNPSLIRNIDIIISIGVFIAFLVLLFS